MVPLRDEWVVLELTPQGEDEDPEILTAAIRRAVKGADVFVPASVSIVGESRIVHRLIDNYVFVRRTLADTDYLKLEETRYISSILTFRRSVKGHSLRHIAAVSSKDVDKMRKQIAIETEQAIEVGDEVQVMSGPYKGINGQIIEDLPEINTVQVFIKLRSKEALVALPRSFLRFIAKGSAELPTFSPFGTKVARVREWMNHVGPVIRWPSESFGPIDRSVRKLRVTARWVSSGDALFRFIRTYNRAFDMSVIHARMEEVRKISSWISKGHELFQASKVSRLKYDVSPVEKAYIEYRWLHDAVKRFESLASDVNNIEKLILAKPNMIQNLVIDGHNLAIRAGFALARREPLTDPEGNPTGLIYGFLNSLGALKKRFENAVIYVSWDGSPQRRVKLYNDALHTLPKPVDEKLDDKKVVGYKANRVRRVESDTQIEQLKKILPALGVVQVFHPEEETDDLIACLVRGRLKGERNIIVSTDHDFLQLVTLTDLVLMPKVGTRKEVLYDRDKVVEEYGVTPERMTHLRALLGDTSDNIPGVPRVPTKVLTGLLNAHGSIDGVFASNLAGLTQNQFEKLCGAEKQVRLNVELMTLRDDLDFRTFEVSPDAELVSQLLAGLAIQPEPFVKTFFRPPSKGFLKG